MSWAKMKIRTKVLTIVAAIYLTGCFCSYKYAKYKSMNSIDFREWTKRDRAEAIALSTGSWCAVIALGMHDALNEISNDEIAEW